MSDVYQVTGELTDSRHVTLDQPVPLPMGKVRIVVEGISTGSKPDLVAFERELRVRQAARGHTSPTKEEIDAYLNAERDSWDS
jgi:hypothetical protein